MQKNFLPFRFALCALCLLSLFGLRAYGQEKDKDQTSEHPSGIVQDWSRRHLAYPRVGPIKSMIALQDDPRALLSWQEQTREDWHRDRNRQHHRDHDDDQDGTPTASGIHRDWSISLGLGSTAPAMYPAKFGFDPTAVPSCSADFVVFPVNATGVSFVTALGNVTSGSTTVAITSGTITPSDVGRRITGSGIPANDTIATVTGNPATSVTLVTAATATLAADALLLPGQPNIVAFNNLYSGGTSGAPTGLCGSRTVVSGDDRSSATALWSYDINAAGGLVATSPALSIDGTKIAFVETVAATSSHFHVLAWHSGDGLDITASNAQNVLDPATISSFTGLVAPAAGSGTASDLVLGSTSDTLSSPFVDYNKDVAYVGNDAGVLFRIKDVFCPTVPLIDASCAGGSPPAPSLDITWNLTGSVTIGGTCTGVLGKLTGAVVDFSTGNVFVGCANGNLYGFTSSGAPLTPAFVAVGDTSATVGGGIVDPPLIDVVNGFAYAVSGSSGGASVLVQAKTDFSSNRSATLGNGAQHPLHAPSFNDAYFSSGTIANWLIYDWAVNGAGNITLYGVSFAAGHVMTTGPAANSFTVGGSSSVELSPTTEFMNGTDQLFVSGRINVSPNFIEENINAFPGSITTSTAEGTGTSGMVVDNSNGGAQASSIYFGVLGAAAPNGNSAVKLTQSGLN